MEKSNSGGASNSFTEDGLVRGVDCKSSGDWKTTELIDFRSTLIALKSNSGGIIKVGTDLVEGGDFLSEYGTGSSSESGVSSLKVLLHWLWYVTMTLERFSGLGDVESFTSFGIIVDLWNKDLLALAGDVVF